jgi:hypothetical protein
MPVLATNKDNIYAMVNKVRLFIKQRRLVIDKSCEFLIGSIESGIWNKQRTQFDESKVYGQYGDCGPDVSCSQH